MKKSLLLLLVAAAALAIAGCRKDGRFQYWNQASPALMELKAFVATVTDPDCKGYVPPQDRIATFDVDGTLLCETAPFYFNWMLFFHRYLHDSTFTPPEEDRLWAAEAEEYVLAINKIIKIIKMRRELGQKPILSWGNSGGDYPMFHYTNRDNVYPHISFCLLCDDTERELGNEDKALKCKAECDKNGWIPVSMKNEWWTIYGPQVKRN